VKISQLSNLIPRYDVISTNPFEKDSYAFRIDEDPVAETVEFEEEDLEKIEPLLNHIRTQLASGDEKIYNFILDYFAWILQNPLRKPGVVLVFTGEKQGIGKGTLTDFLNDFVFGTRLSYYTNKLSDVLAHFNFALWGKRMCLIDETSVKKDDYLTDFDAFKSEITRPTKTFTKKGKESFESWSTMFYIIFSNHENIVHIESTDRRYAIIEIPDTVQVPPASYFDNLRSTCFNQDCGNLFFSYLLKRPLNFSNLNTQIPQTKIKERLKKKSLPKAYQFIEYVLDNDELETGNISRKDLYTMYKAWAEEEKVKAEGRNSFYEKMAKKFNLVTIKGVRCFKIVNPKEEIVEDE
jgi:hypothetical protein